MALLRVLIGLVLVAAVLSLPFAAAVLTAKGALVPEPGEEFRRAGLWLAAAFPLVAALAAWRAWRGREASGPRAFAWLGLVPATAALSLLLLALAEWRAPAAAPVPRPPEDLRQLAAFLAAPGAPATLDLRGRGLAAVPPEVFGAEGLRELDLRDNRLRALPDQLAAIPGLRVVRIGGNPLGQEEVRRFSMMLTMRGSRLVIVQ